MNNEKTSHLTQTVLIELNELIEKISQDISQRSKAKRTAKDLLHAIEQGDIEVANRLLNNRVKFLSDTYPQVNSTIEKVNLDINRRQADHLRQTTAQLEKYCQSEGITIKGKSPKYTVDNLLDVEFDRKKIRTKVGIQSLSTLKWPIILDALKEEQERLWSRKFDAGKYRDRLIEAYENLEQLNPSPTGWASLDGVYQLLKEQEEDNNPDWRKGGRLIAYYKDEFSADLSMLWQAQSKNDIAPPYIELSAIRDPRRAFKVIQPDRNIALYGFLRPRRV